MSEKRDLKFDKKAEKYDDSYEGKLSKKFYTLVTENVAIDNGLEQLPVGGLKTTAQGAYPIKAPIRSLRSMASVQEQVCLSLHRKRLVQQKRVHIMPLHRLSERYFHSFFCTSCDFISCNR